MKTENFRELLSKYIEGRATPAEIDLIEKWYNSHPDDEVPGILAEGDNEDRIREEIYKAVKPYWYRTPVMRLSLLVIPYAAAVILLFSICIGGWRILSPAERSSFLSYSTPGGKLKRLVLPDSSVVWLNAASKLRVSSDFPEQKVREIYLDEGEAFFEVAGDAVRPFIVHSGGIATRVLGTSFNVKAYKELPEVKITVSSGRVKVSHENTALAILEHDRQIIYNKWSRKFRVQGQESDLSSSWRDGRIFLRNADFSELAMALKNAYGIELTTSSPAIYSYAFNVRINTSRSVETTMSIIASIHQNHFRRKENVIELY